MMMLIKLEPVVLVAQELIKRFKRAAVKATRKVKDKALKSAGIKDNNIIRKVHDEVNVY